MPTSRVGTNVQPVSSSVSRATASLQGFAALEVPGGLVDDDAAARAFFDEQELAVAFDDGGDGDVRLPDHAGIIASPGAPSEVDSRGAHFGLDQAAGPDFVEVSEVALHDARRR